MFFNFLFYCTIVVLFCFRFWFFANYVFWQFLQYPFLEACFHTLYIRWDILIDICSWTVFHYWVDELLGPKHLIRCGICWWMHSRLMCSWGSHRFQSLLFSLRTLTNMFFSVQLLLWTTPLLSRWYGVVHLLSAPNMSVKFWKILLVKCCPLVCVCKCYIIPKHDTHSLMSLLATVAVLWSAVAWASGRLVKQSETTKILSGSTTSEATHSMGCPTQFVPWPLIAATSLHTSDNFYSNPPLTQTTLTHGNHNSHCTNSIPNSNHLQTHTSPQILDNQ